MPGILAWAVRGCVEWVEHGLGSAAAVDRATDAYRAETDVTERFFKDECEFGPKKFVTRKDLFAAWETWCFDEGADPGTQNMFTRTMRERGVLKNFGEGKAHNNTRGWRGIGLKSAPADPPNGKVPPPEKSCKEGGIETDRGQFSSKSANFPTEPSRVEGFEKSGEKCPQSEKVPPNDDGVLWWEIDGVRWEFVTSEEN